MPRDISPYSGGAPAPFSRSTRRELDRLENQRVMEIARIEVATDVQAVRVGAIGYIGSVAMLETARLSQGEAQLAAMVPHAAARLQYIADRTTQELAGLVSDTVRRVNRCSCS
jgi:ActR/RegA family two-component response regulator